MHAFLGGRLRFLDIAARDRGRARGDASPCRCGASTTSTRRTRRRARRRRRSSSGWRCALELVPRVRGLRGADHPARVRPLRRRQGGRHARRAVRALLPAVHREEAASARPSTAIGAIPLGGFVKITGMNPEEELPPDVAPRAYYHQPVWKRIVVIGAGPFDEPPDRVPDPVRARVRRQRARRRAWPTPRPGSPAARVLEPGDRIISVDGVRGRPGRPRAPDLQPPLPRRAAARLPGAATPAVVQVERDGRVADDPRAAALRPRPGTHADRVLVRHAAAEPERRRRPRTPRST